MNLAAVATAAGVAYVLGRLVSRNEAAAARREASTDALTGLTNRAGLMRQLHNRARRGRAYTVYLLDLNGFKAINDTHGHRTGDELLTRLAARLRHELTGHLVARLGGDEFVVLVDHREPGALGELDMAAWVATVVARPVKLATAGAPVTVGTAVGVARGEPGADPRVVLHTADLAMYRSKKVQAPYRLNSSGRPPVSDQPRTRVRDARRVRVAYSV